MNARRKRAKFHLLVDGASPKADLLLDFRKAKQPTGSRRREILNVRHGRSFGRRNIAQPD